MPQNYSSIIFFVAIIGVFYFLIIKPQKKRQKDQAELMQTLVPGADILTIGGIYGTIVSIDDDRVRIAVADGSELVMAKRAIAQVVGLAPEVGDAPDEEENDSDPEPDDTDTADDANAAHEADEGAGSAATEPGDDVSEDDRTDV